MASMIDLPVDVVRSRKRKRTIQAYVVDGRVRVLVPAGLPGDEEARLVETMVARATRRFASTHRRPPGPGSTSGPPLRPSVPVDDRVVRPPADAVGSCTPSDGKIRISNRLARMPGWVLDWVIVHELAHLVVPDHGDRFQALVSRYELGERAEGYLIAKSEG